MRARSREDSTADISVFCGKRRGLGGRNSQGADSRTGEELFEGGVELRVEENGAADGAADLGEKEIGLAKVEAGGNLVDQRSKLAGGLAQNFARGGVSGIGSRGHNGENRGKDVVRHGLRAMLHYRPFGAAKLGENLFAERGIGSRFFSRINRSGDGAAPDIVSAAFIAGSGAVASCSMDFPLRVAAECGGARSRDKHDGGPFPRGRQGGFEIGEDRDGG